MIDLTDDLAALRDEFGEPVIWLPKVGSSVSIADAVRYNETAEGFDGRSQRRIAFEITLPAGVRPPAKDDALRDAAGVTWIVTQTTRRAESGAWLLDVEKARQ